MSGAAAAEKHLAEEDSLQVLYKPVFVRQLQLMHEPMRVLTHS